MLSIQCYMTRFVVFVATLSPTQGFDDLTEEQKKELIPQAKPVDPGSRIRSIQDVKPCDSPIPHLPAGTGSSISH